MIPVLCIDDNMGLMFNKRRQSQDRLLRSDLLRFADGREIWMNHFSAALFARDAETFPANLVVDEDFLSKAAADAFCFVEDCDLHPYADRVEALILYRWNRIYPADRYLACSFCPPPSGSTEKTPAAPCAASTMELLNAHNFNSADELLNTHAPSSTEKLLNAHASGSAKELLDAHAPILLTPDGPRLDCCGSQDFPGSSHPRLNRLQYRRTE